MLSPQIHADRRRALSLQVGEPILLMGHAERPRNLPMSPVPFRQDSTFLYFTGCTLPGAAVFIENGQSTLYLTPAAADDALWHGATHSIDELAAELGFTHVQPIDTLEELGQHQSRIATLAVPDLAQTQRAARITKTSLVYGKNNGHDGLISAVISMRRILSDAELDEIRATARVTESAHRAAMAATAPGVHERVIAAKFQEVIHREGLALAYSSIVTVRGEVLHNFNYVNTMQDGQLLLLDGGAEAQSGYATDVTRTWPVSGSFSNRQRNAYEAVLEAQLNSIALVRPGTRYRDVHLESARIIAQFLADENLIHCSPDEAVETGAHALFFPHGVGHLIGLDVHDLENFGDRASYPSNRSRSPQFGTGYLRLDLDLQTGMVVTVEPGFYIVPAILGDPQFQNQFAKQVNFEKALSWTGFGGIRIEDDIAVTSSEPEVLTGSIPKTVRDIEAAVAK